MSKSTSVSPWHLWGTSSENLALDSAVLGSTGQTAQLCRVHYKRPESFHFVFQALVTSMTNPTSDFQLDIFFDLIIGVGRSKLSIPAFEHFQLSSVGGFTPAFPVNFWSAQVPSPNRLQSVSAPGTSSAPGVCSQLVSEDIQCNGRAIFLGSPGNRVNLELTAQFAPLVHVRPDWFGHPEFDGGERGGR